MENCPPEYSVLYPDTNSDSPSVRSNGVRLVSARIVISHIRTMADIFNIMVGIKLILTFCLLIVSIIISLGSKMISIVIS
jgi:hypothetical protein